VLFVGIGVVGNGKYLPMTDRIAINFEVISPTQKEDINQLTIFDMN
jgi:hypothetical protein